jgi:hypothetical protein
MPKRSRARDSFDKNDEGPKRVQLPGFITDEEIGLGDVIKRATSHFGIKPCASCEQRAAMLNRWIVFTSGHRR